MRRRLALLLLLPACAYLTVDVDVYQGPLVNHERVQVEQVAVMAVSAKPILARLKSKMADAAETGARPKAAQDLIESVDAILTLYNDLPHPRLLGYSRRLQDELVRYQDAYVSALLTEDDFRLFDHALHSLHGADDHPEICKACEAFLAPGDRIRNPNAIFQAFHNHSPGFPDPAGRSRDELMDLLTDREQVAAALEGVFDNEMAEAVSDRVSGIAIADREARDSYRKLWEILVESLADLPPTAALATYRDAAAKTAARMVYPPAVAAAVSNEALEGADAPRTLLNQQFKEPLLAIEWGPDASPKRTELRAAIEELLLRPAGARDLLLAHNRFRTRFSLPKTELKVQKRIDNYATDKVRRQGGLVRDEEAKGLPTLTELQPFLQDVTREIDFEGGRLPDGLVTLIENYLDHASGKPTEFDPADADLVKLLDALVRFAQKVTFLANHEFLLSSSPDRTVKEYVRVLQAVGNGILVQVDELTHRRMLHGDGAKERAEGEQAAWAAAVRAPAGVELVLEELLLGLDKTEHAAAIAAIEGARPTVHASFANAAARPTRGEVLDRLAEELRTRGDVAARELILRHRRGLKDVPIGSAESPQRVLEQLQAALQQEYIESVRRLGRADPASKRIAEALEAARLYRSSKVYLRPTSSYLRTSYAASTLKSVDTETGELHQDAEDARILQEIDKQFWQNVNRVRLEGAGRTNYVVAKDDIGNWYIKKYSADPQDMIKTAQNLALFAAEMYTGTGMLTRVGADGEIIDRADAPGGATDGPVAGQIKKFRERYEKATAEDYEAVRGAPDAVQAAVAAAWQRGLGERSKEIEGALADAPTMEEAEKVEKKDRPDRIVAGLRELLRYHHAAQKALRDKDLEKAEREAVEKAEAPDTAGVAASEKSAQDLKVQVDELERKAADGDAAAKAALPGKRAELQTAQEKLEAARKKHAELTAALAAKREALAAIRAKKQLAHRELTRAFRDHAGRLVQQRRATVRRYEEALLVIDESLR